MTNHQAMTSICIIRASSTGRIFEVTSDVTGLNDEQSTKAFDKMLLTLNKQICKCGADIKEDINFINHQSKCKFKDNNGKRETNN